MKSSTSSYYQKKIEDVLQYIHNHLDENITINRLAEYAGISAFHFHRILRGSLHEPLGSYIDKVRLDTAIKLMRYSEESITSIAEKIGYNDVSSFSKAFNKEFGLSPQNFRLNSEITLNTKIDYHINVEGQIVSHINPKIIHLPDKKVIYERIQGEYGGKEVYESWNQLIDFIMEHKLLGWNPELFSIYYDDPYSVSNENCTSDLCFTTKKDIEHPIFKMKKIEGGKYAAFKYKGPYERLFELYDKIYSDWLTSTDYRLRDVPPLEKYINYLPKTKPENLLTAIYIPIE